MESATLAQAHWNEHPLFLAEEERYRIYPWLYEVAEFRHHRGERVLEIGCGTGCDLLQFAKHGAIATGVDITDEHLRLAQERVGTLAEVRRADARHLPFPDASFDYVYSHGVIHHSHEPGKIAGEILRVLRPGGRFNIHVYSLYSYYPLRLRMKLGKQWKRGTENTPVSDVHVDLYTARELRELFPACKLSVGKQELAIAGTRIPRWTFLPQMFGWYLIAKGRRPA